VSARYRDEDYNILSTSGSVALPANVVAQVPIGTGNHNFGAIPSDACYYEILIDGIPQWSAKITCCDCCDDEMGEIAFLEPLGGWSTVKFCPVSQSIVSSFAETCRIQDCDISFRDKMSGSRSAYLDMAYEKVTLLKELPRADESEFWTRSIDFTRALLSSPSKYLLFRYGTIANNTTWARFIPESSEGIINKFDDCTELQLVGYYSVNWQAIQS
jgi:hypothetical protein